MFPHGADAYIDDISALVPLTDGNIRTALDTGCGVSLLDQLQLYFVLSLKFVGFKDESVLAVIQVASWGAFLLKRDNITMSFAPRDSHEAQVQFALERGVPAMIGVMATDRIPYPARAFDMAHCSRCFIPWNKLGRVYMFLLQIFSYMYVLYS
jgi:hypothetical protein